MALAPRRVDPLDIINGIGQAGRKRRELQQGNMTSLGVWNPMLHGAPGVEQGPFVGDRPGFSDVPGDERLAGLSAIDPVAAQGIVRLGLEDPDRFAMVMASTGAPPPVMPKAQDRLVSDEPQPRPVQTETIRPDTLTPAQRITRGEGDIAGRVREPLPPGQRLPVEPGATRQQALGDLLRPQPDLIAAPAPEPVLGPMLEQERVIAPDVVAPPVAMPEVDLMNPVPIEQQQAALGPLGLGAGGQTSTGTNQGLAGLGQALLGVKMPEEPRVPPPMPAPAAPRPTQAIQPSATLMSLLLGSLGRGRTMPLRVGG